MLSVGFYTRTVTAHLFNLAEAFYPEQLSCEAEILWERGEVPGCQKFKYPYDLMRISRAFVFWFRWLCYCHVPQSNDSLPRYETCQVFGRSLLKSIFTVTRRQLLEKFRVEKDKLPPEKRTLILTHFPKYDTRTHAHRDNGKICQTALQ